MPFKILRKRVALKKIPSNEHALLKIMTSIPREIPSRWNPVVLLKFAKTDHRWDFSKLYETKFFQIHNAKISKYVQKFRFTILQNHHWNIIRTRCLREINVGMTFLTFCGSYGDIMHYDIIYYALRWCLWPLRNR